MRRRRCFRSQRARLPCPLLEVVEAVVGRALQRDDGVHLARAEVVRCAGHVGRAADHVARLDHLARGEAGGADELGRVGVCPLRRVIVRHEHRLELRVVGEAGRLRRERVHGHARPLGVAHAHRVGRGGGGAGLVDEVAEERGRRAVRGQREGQRISRERLGRELL
eukprot:6210207-Pleurochrysis_carterae.AAC.4